MKKRMFSVLLAVVMVLTAINLAPVIQVYATMGHGTTSEGAGGKYEWDHNEGHWGQPRYYYNDGDYTKTDISGYSNGSNDVSEFTSATRHVTIFNDCTYRHTGIDSDGGKHTSDDWMPIAKSTAGNKFTTLRGQNFVTEYYGDSGANDPNNYRITLDQQWMPPYLVYGSGMASRENVDGSYVKFKADNEKDIRMIFRNYNNSDYTYYTRNPSKPNYGATNQGVTLRPGIDFGDYDYLEFDIKFESGLNITKASLAMARVYLYYETNDASGKSLEGGHQIEGYNDPVIDSAMNFKDQLFNGDTLLADNTWLTVRIDIGALEKGNTVKQVVVRIADPNMNTNCYIYMDDIRLVKNDDHPGVVYDHNNTGAADSMNYPSGKYFMINDFEYNGDTARYDLYSHGYDSTIYPGSNVAETHAGQKFNVTTWNLFYPAIRQADANANDTICMKYQDGWSCNWGTQNENEKYRRNFIGGTNTVTQGDFALAVETPQKNQQSNITALAGWLNPLCYERHYSSPLDLSSYTHFAIDVAIHTIGSDGIAQPQNTGEGVAPGVTFALELYDPSTVGGDNYNYTKGASILFFLPFGQYPWNYTGSRLYGDERYGTILPLGTEDKDYYAAKGSTTTPYGNFRLVFTREQLMAGMAADNGADLSAIKGMRFVWLNRAPTSTNGPPMYSYPVTVTRKETNGTITTVYTGQTTADNKDSLRYRIILDNFIAYTPDTSITIVNQMDDVPTKEKEIDLNQQFVYRIYGGYNATEAGCLGNSELGTINTRAHFDGSDPITKEVDLTVAVPAGGKVTVRNLPFNSYFITQQNFSWRYTVADKICTLNSDNAVYKNSNANAMCNHNAASSHTASMKPIMWVDGTKTFKTNSNIWDVMHSRGGITVTFIQERTNPFSLNNNSVGASAFCLWSEYDYCFRDWVDTYYNPTNADDPTRKAYMRHSKTPLHWID